MICSNWTLELHKLKHYMFKSYQTDMWVLCITLHYILFSLVLQKYNAKRKKCTFQKNILSFVQIYPDQLSPLASIKGECKKLQIAMINQTILAGKRRNYLLTSEQDIAWNLTGASLFLAVIRILMKLKNHSSYEKWRSMLGCQKLDSLNENMFFNLYLYFSPLTDKWYVVDQSQKQLLI